MYLHGTSRINEQGHLEIGGCDTLELVKTYGTPLYIYDETLMRKKIRQFVETFRESGFKFQVAYASKAFCTVAMCQLAKEESMSLDVVSMGELYTAIKAGFPVERIHLHGNNKSIQEIEMALDVNIGCFVVDNFYEITLLQQLAQEKGKTASVLLRITPGVEAHTHEYITTGQQDSKFGFDLISGQALKATQQVHESANLHFLGFHCHIGSQIFETNGFVMAVERIYEFLETVRTQLQVEIKVLNLGGGYGIRYKEGDTPLPGQDYIKVITDAVRSECEKRHFALPEIWIEPGRSIVGDAGTTLYRVGASKSIPGIRKYLAVDGGMTDNPRPALYQAVYEAALANRMNEANEETVSIAGKCCESGDMLIWDLQLPRAQAGDLLAVTCTGAYNYAMASNYNRFQRPAIVFVKDGQAALVVKRESLDDLIQNDLQAEFKPLAAPLQVN